MYIPNLTRFQNSYVDKWEVQTHWVSDHGLEYEGTCILFCSRSNFKVTNMSLKNVKNVSRPS